MKEYGYLDLLSYVKYIMEEYEKHNVKIDQKIVCGVLGKTEMTQTDIEKINKLAESLNKYITTVYDKAFEVYAVNEKVRVIDQDMYETEYQKFVDNCKNKSE